MKRDPTRAHARRNDHKTSCDAAEAITPQITHLQGVVLRFAKRVVGGFIDPELELAMGNNGSTFRTRRRELVDMGLIAAVGQRRPEGSAREFIVWEITPAGRKFEIRERTKT